MGASARSEATRSSSRIGTPASGSTWEPRSTSVPTILSNTSCRGNASGCGITSRSVSYRSSPDSTGPSGSTGRACPTRHRGSRPRSSPTSTSTTRTISGSWIPRSRFTWASARRSSWTPGRSRRAAWTCSPTITGPSARVRAWTRTAWTSNRFTLTIPPPPPTDSWSIRAGGTIAYTGDLRQHGPHSEMTKDFIDAAKTNEPIALITEGTRVTPADPRANFTEALVKSKSIETAGRAKGKAVFATFYPRDVDRMRTFVEVAKAVDRQFVVQARAAHLLVSLSQDTRIQVPDVLRDPDLLVYDRRFHRQETWEKNLFAQLGDRVVTSDYVREHQDELVVQLDFTTMPELIDIQPVPGSAFIHSKSEPIEENDEVEKAVANWVRFFKLRRSQYHASGHMSEREIADMIRAIAPKAVIPIHTEYPERFAQFASHVVQPVLASPMPVG